MRCHWLAVAGFCLSNLVAGAAQAGAELSLQPHLAVYDLSLARAGQGADIDTLDGRMVYEFRGSPCDGYTTKFRFVTRVDNGEDVKVTDLRTTNFESTDGKTFRFTNRTFVNSALAQDVSGSARQAGNATLVTLTQPKAKSLALVASQFPTTHMLEMIGKAEAGEHFYQTTIFDGSEDANRVMTTTVILGRQETGKATGEDAGPMGALAEGRRWPVSIAYYYDDDRIGGLPTFRSTFELYADGITRDLLMDYGDFAIKGKLVALRLLDRPDCQR